MKKNSRLILLVFMLGIFSTFANVELFAAATSGTINIQGLSDRSNLNTARVHRGDNHSREDIPYIVPAGTEVVMKQVSGLNRNDLSIQALNNDRATEANYTLSKSGSELKFTVNYDSVIFIRMPRGDQNIDIEYSFSQDVIETPHYNEGDSETEFFAYWDSSDAPYAIVENEDIQFLLPKADKEYVRNISGNTTHANLDGLLQYYSRLVTHYDNLLGVEDNAANPVHNNPDQQFFAKANKSGAGLAYYSTNEMAMSAANFGYRYLSVGWVEKHEIGHGYQQNAMMDAVEWPENSISVREVWNNVYAHSFRSLEEWQGDNAYDSNRVSKSELQYTVNNSYEAGTLFQRLNFFVSMFDAFGYEGFTGFNREYRELANMSPARNDEYSNSQYMAWYFSEYTGVNFVPHFENAGIEIIEEIEDKPEIRDLSYAQYLNFVILDNATRQEISTILDLQADYEMIDTSLLRAESLSHLNLKGDVEVNLNIDDFDEIKYKKVVLKNGEFEISKEIESNQVTFSDVPSGVYRVMTPASESGNYKINHSELITVNESGNVSTTVSYTKQTPPVIDELSATNSMLLKGLGNYVYATVETFPDRVRVRTKNTQPHSYYSDEYANVKVLDTNGAVVFEQSFIGNVALAAETFNIPISPGYKLVMTFREPGRSTGVNSYSGLDIYPATSTFSIMMDESGTYVNDKNILSDVVDTYAGKYNDNSDNQYYYHNERVELNQSIARMEASDQDKYYEKYKDNLQLKRPIFENTDVDYVYEIPLAKNSNAIMEVISGVKVIDFEDGDLTSKIEIISNDVDLTTEGTYTVSLRVEDSDKNANYAEVTVKVVKAQPHPITGKESAVIDEHSKISAKILIELFEVVSINNQTITVDMSAVDMKLPGEYQVIFTDEDGKEFNALLTVNDVLPKIEARESVTVQTGSDINVVLGKLRIVGTEIVSGDMTSSVTYDDSNVDYNIPGEYILTLSLSDDEENYVSLEVIVVITDEEIVEPIIGDEAAAIDEGSILVDQTLIDLFNIISVENKSITVDSSKVNVNVPGLYQVIFTDEDGEIFIGLLTIVDILPVIVIDSDSITITEGCNIEDILKQLNVVGSEISNGDLTDNVIVDDSNIDYTKPGIYKLLILLSDDEGNEVSREVTITIIEKEIENESEISSEETSEVNSEYDSETNSEEKSYVDTEIDSEDKSEADAKEELNKNLVSTGTISLITIFAILAILLIIFKNKFLKLIKD